MLFSSLFLHVVLVRSVVAENTIQQICGGLTGVLGCTKKIDIPVSAEAKMCPNKVPEVSYSSTMEPA